jgi:branched-chain amino acid transport system permease protein
MTPITLFALLGLGSGALVAGLALAIVLVHRGSGVVNLATGAVAMVAGYAYWALRTGELGPSWPAAPALVAAIAIAVVVGVLIEVIAFRPLRALSPLAQLAASLGALLTAQAGVLLAFGTAAKPVPSLLPDGIVKVGGATVPVDRLVIAGVVSVVAVLLWALYRWSRFGLATRAAAENPSGALLAGLSIDALAVSNAMIASAVAAVVGLLSTSIVQLDATALPLQVVPALAAALFARFTSFAIACTAGLAIGVAQSLLYYASTQSWFPTDHGTPLPGVQQLLVFGLVVAAMFLRGAPLPRRGDVLDRRLPAVAEPRRLGRTAAIAGSAAAAALVVLPYDFRQALITSLIAALVVMSYVVLTGYIGQLSVVQLALSGVAGFALSHLATDAGIGFPLGAVAAIALSTVIGLVAAFSALRVRGVNLAIVTLAAAVALERFVFANTTWGGGSGGSTVPQPRLFGVDLGPAAAFRGLDGRRPSPVFGLLVLAITVAVGVYVANLRRTELGHRMLAVRADERAAAAVGTHVRNVKLAGFAISAAIAGLVGVLSAYNFGSVSATRYGALSALGVIAFAYVGGVTVVSGAVVAGMLSTEALLPHALHEWLGLSGTWALLVGGVALIVTLRLNPLGIAGSHRT